MVRSSRHFLWFLVLILTLTIAFGDLYGQVNRYMVHLKDKQGTQFTVDDPSVFLSPRAISRRSKQNIAITEQDLPLSSTYLEGIRNTGAEIQFTSKWFNAALIQCDSVILEEIVGLPFVNSIEFVAPGPRISMQPLKDTLEVTSIGDDFVAREMKLKQEASEFQNSLLGVEELHGSGITGQGILIAVMDGGFFGVKDVSAFSPLIEEDRIKYTYDFIAGQSDVYLYSIHGTKVLSVLAANDPGLYSGVSYDSDYMLFVTEDDCPVCEYRIEEYNWVFAAELADSAGVDVINTSLGYNWFEDPSMDYTQSQMDGKTSVITQAADIAFSKGILVVASAGNEGRNDWGIITAPADAFNVISVGNITATSQLAPTSSLGPSADGRIKPDVVALGSGVQVISSSGNIVSGSGTSFSSPQVAGLCALIWQVHPELTAEDIRFLLQETASNSANPDNQIGYGIPNFNSLENYLDFSDSEVDFLLYPNPVLDDQITIRVNNPGEIPKLDLNVINSNGQKVMVDSIDFTWQNNVHIVDMASLPPGIYIIMLNYSSVGQKFRIVKI